MFNRLDERFVRKNDLTEVVDDIRILVDKIDKSLRTFPTDDVPVAAGVEPELRRERRPLRAPAEPQSERRAEAIVARPGERQFR